MSKIHRELQTSDDSQWFVRISDGAIYGPVDLTTLQSWAAQGRIEPDNEISEDQKQWSPAESLPDLEMDWIADLEDDATYGPFNIQLAPELLKRGTLPPGATLRHRETGETRAMATNDDNLTFSFDDTPSEPVATERESTRNVRKDAPAPADETVVTEETEALEPTTRETSTLEDAPDPTEDELTVEPDDDPTLAPEAADPPTAAPTPKAEIFGEPTEEPTVAPKADETSQGPIEAEPTDTPEQRDIVAQRLTTLQQSASQARSQLASTRKTLTEQRAVSTARQEQIRKLEEDLSNAESEKAASDRQFLEQEDTVAQAESEVENLNAQLQQLQEHYDRLQIESQKQFEAIDELRAESMQREQEYKHRIGLEKDRATAKTSILTSAIRLIAADEDVEHGDVPPELLAPTDSGQVQELQARITQLQQQDDRERKYKQTLEMQLAATRGSRRGNLLIVVLLIAVLGLAIWLTFALASHQTQDAVTSIPTQSTPSVPVKSAKSVETKFPTERVALAGLIVTNRERIKTKDELRVAADEASELDLAPEAGNSPSIPKPRAPVNWPSLKIPGALVSTTDTSCEIAFTYGTFSSATKLKPDACRDLVDISNQIRSRIADFTLLVEGHTDATPISSQGAKYVDNFALGMARAESVKHFLEEQCRLPEGFIRTASAGEADPPHPNDSDASRRKNRTVVLTLSPR